MITYSITRELQGSREMFVLRDSTGSEMPFFSREAAEKEKTLWRFEAKFHNLSLGGLKDRIRVAKAFLKAGYDRSGSRVWDNCFESADGHLVAEAVGL